MWKDHVQFWFDTSCLKFLKQLCLIYLQFKFMFEILLLVQPGIIKKSTFNELRECRFLPQCFVLQHSIIFKDLHCLPIN